MDGSVLPGSTDEFCLDVRSQIFLKLEKPARNNTTLSGSNILFTTQQHFILYGFLLCQVGSIVNTSPAVREHIANDRIFTYILYTYNIPRPSVWVSNFSPKRSVFGG